MTFSVKVVQWGLHKDTLMNLRHEVFIDEQNIPEELEWDGEDEHCTHFIISTNSNDDIGCARLQKTGKIERMCILKDYRNRNAGMQLLQQILSFAKNKNYSQVTLHAQAHAVPFYQKAGFAIQGPAFEEAGIEHYHMHFSLKN